MIKTKTKNDIESLFNRPLFIIHMSVYEQNYIHFPLILVKKILHILSMNPTFVLLGEDCIGKSLRKSK